VTSVVTGIDAPLVPDVGVLALVPDRWSDLWQQRHQVLTRLARYFHVTWMNPAREWRAVLTGPVARRTRQAPQSRWRPTTLRRRPMLACEGTPSGQSHRASPLARSQIMPRAARAATVQFVISCRDSSIIQLAATNFVASRRPRGT